MMSTTEIINSFTSNLLLEAYLGDARVWKQAPTKGYLLLAGAVVLGLLLLGLVLWHITNLRRQPRRNIGAVALELGLLRAVPLEDMSTFVPAAVRPELVGSAPSASSAVCEQAPSSTAPYAPVVDSIVVVGEQQGLPPITESAGTGAGDSSFGPVELQSVTGSNYDNMCCNLAKRCGTEVRLAMGYPKRTATNRTIAAQRCLAWLKENAPSLRVTHLRIAVAKAVVVALTVDPVELDAADATFSTQAADYEHYVHVSHVNPRYTGPVGKVLALCGCVTASAPDF